MNYFLTACLSFPSARWAKHARQGVQLFAFIFLTGLALTSSRVAWAAPSVSSITVTGTPATTDTSIAFTVTFSEPVNNVSTDDFTLVGFGTATGTIASVSASSGTIIDVNIASITGNGSIKLNLNGSTNIQNAANEGVALYSSGSTHTVAIPNAPGAPTIGTATPGDAQATVTFTAPSDGGSPITLYTATANPGGATGSCAGPTACTITVGSLTNGTAYTFSVTATNDVGTGSASGASNSVTPKANQVITFAQPNSYNFGTTPNLIATAGSGLAVSFTSSTTGVCTISSGGSLTFISAGTCTIDADQAGNAATNAASTVTRSFTVNAIVPSAPTIGTATPGDQQATVTFTAPSSSGGASIIGYTVTANPGGNTGTGAGSPITVTGLTNGVPYTFTVTATNTAGTGGASGNSNSATPASPQVITFANPGARNFGTTPTLTASSDSGLTVTFTSSTTGVCTITSSGVLAFITTGTCTIHANQAGNSSYLAATEVARSFTVQAVVPGAPTSVVATAGDTQVSVAFAAPTNTGGTLIIGYTVTVSPADVAPVNGAGSPIVIQGLTNGQPYTFTVTADNSAGTGAASQASNSATPRAGQTITFANPGSQNFGTTPTLLATSDSGLTPTFTSSTTLVCTITPGGALTFLTAGTCTINADQAGNGSYLPATQTTRNFTVNAVVPGAPTIGTATAGNARVEVTFTPPVFGGGAPITGYTVTATTVPGGATSTITGTASPIAFTGLSDGTTYNFMVAATNSAGTGPVSAASGNVTPVGPEEPPTPPTKGDVSVPAGGSGALTGPGNATLGSGATLTVQSSAAGGSITPPATGTATVRLGDAGGGVSLAQAGSGGRAVVLTSASNSGGTVLGLGSGSLFIGSTQAGQVLLDVGTPGAGNVASGRQVVAGPGGARILAQRGNDGSLTIEVLEGSAGVPCAGPCLNPPSTIFLQAGEKAVFDSQGLAQQITVAIAPLSTPVPGGLQLPKPPADLTGAPPLRTASSTPLLGQMTEALKTLLGAALVGNGQQPLGNATWSLPDGTTLGLLPLAPPFVNLTVPDGVLLNSDGTLVIASHGVVQTFGPAPVDLVAVMQALQALAPGAQLSVGAAGTWRITGPSGLALAVRPSWLGSASGSTGQAPRFELDAAGQLLLIQTNGLRIPVLPALAEPRALQALLQAADPQLQWSVGLDGTARVMLLGQPYVLVPEPVLAVVPGTDAVWLELQADGRLLLRVRLGDGLVQTLVVRVP